MKLKSPDTSDKLDVNASIRHSEGETMIGAVEHGSSVNGHEPKYVTVANGAGRVVCSCGWSSRVQDDGLMFVDSYDAMNDWKNHAS